MVSSQVRLTTENVVDPDLAENLCKANGSSLLSYSYCLKT